MSDSNLGLLLEGPATRDAIHVAIAPMIADDYLKPGERIGLVPGTTDKATNAEHVVPIGIVDPFLTKKVKPGQRFYMCLFPKTVTGMTHHWSHPAFVDQQQDIVKQSEDWVRAYAELHCPYDSQKEDMVYEGHVLIHKSAPDQAYRHFLENAKNGNIYFHGSDLHYSGELPDAESLLHHLSILLGKKVGKDDFTYSCSC